MYQSRASTWALLAISILVAKEARGTIVNGHFASGDVSGWQVAALNDDDQPVAPPIAVEVIPQGNLAAIATVPYTASAAFLPITDLSQLFTVSGDILVFDIGFKTAPAVGEINDHLFRDSLAVLLSDGASVFTLLAVDAFGLTLDPFGDAPGSILRTPSGHPSLSDHIEFHMDLAGMVSHQVTLQFEVLNQTDGQASIARVGRGIGRVKPPRNPSHRPRVRPRRRPCRILKGAVTIGLPPSPRLDEPGGLR